VFHSVLEHAIFIQKIEKIAGKGAQPLRQTPPTGGENPCPARLRRLDPGAFDAQPLPLTKMLNRRCRLQISL